MKVAFINDWMKGGGAERSMAYIANGIASKGVPLDLFALESGLSYSLHSDVKYYNFRKKFINKAHKLISIPVDSYRLAKRSRASSYDLVLSFQFRSNLINVISKFFGAKHKVIISERVNPELFYSNQWYSIVAFPIIRFFYNKADYITCNSSETKNSLFNIGVTPKVKVITNGYDKDNILQVANERLLPSEEAVFESKKVNILLLGRYNKQKGQLSALEALSLIKDKGRFNLVLLGEGEDEEKIKSRVDALGLKSSVKLHPFNSNPYKFIKRSDFLLMPSLYEGYPNVACESLILKKPILAFEFKSASKELITSNNGKLVKVNDILSLSKEIEKFEFRSYDVDSRKIITIEQLVDNYYKLFKELI